MHLLNFPKVGYSFGSGDLGVTEFSNLTLFSNLTEVVGDEASIYRFYDVQDGQRPDVVSTVLYGTSEYYWTLFLLNEHVRTDGWPLSQQSLDAQILKELPGQVMTFFGESAPGIHAIIGSFPVGSPIKGTISGASGTVYRRDPIRGQIFVDVDSGTFIANEDVVDTILGEPQYRLTARVVKMACLGIHHWEDEDGATVDVDYRVDFRGLSSSAGGVFDDEVFSDPALPGSPYTAVTYKDIYEARNAELSKIKVLTAAAVPQVASLFKKSINR